MRERVARILALIGRDRVGVVDGPLDEVGDGDVESLRECVPVEFGVVWLVVVEVAFEGVVRLGESSGGKVGVDELDFGDGGEDCVDGECD